MSQSSHYVVGIGASAGGLDTIQAFFDHMPENKNLTLVIVRIYPLTFPR